MNAKRNMLVSLMQVIIYTKTETNSAWMMWNLHSITLSSPQLSLICLTYRYPVLEGEFEYDFAIGSIDIVPKWVDASRGKNI